MKRALVVGLNSYTKQKSLRGAVNDAALISDLLRHGCHVPHCFIVADRKKSFPRCSNEVRGTFGTLWHLVLIDTSLETNPGADDFPTAGQPQPK